MEALPNHPHAPGDDDVAVAAREFRAAVTRISRRLRAEEPVLSLAQTAVLGHLVDVGPRTTSWLATAEGVRPQSMAQVVLELEAAGLVERRPDDVDRRQVIVEVTAAGRRAFDEDRASRDESFREAITSVLNSRERSILLRAIPVLARLSILP
ncbi:MAG: winged helix-turn-helix transcriptional regulator [Actinobacteria bacterium]|nr:winged helix-turn-helix transcriptional regulator [Actinomycetota bacterium]